MGLYNTLIIGTGSTADHKWPVQRGHRLSCKDFAPRRRPWTLQGRIFSSLRNRIVVVNGACFLDDPAVHSNAVVFTAHGFFSRLLLRPGETALSTGTPFQGKQRISSRQNNRRWSPVWDSYGLCQLSH